MTDSDFDIEDPSVERRENFFRRRKERERRCYYKLWKGGAWVKVRFKGSKVFQKTEETALLSRERIFGVDTESLTKKGALTTLLVPLYFHDGGVMLETPSGRNILEAFLMHVDGRFGEREPRPSWTKQRSKGERASRLRGIKDGRDGRRATIEPVLSVWFNLSYDFGRMTVDMKHLLRSLAFGADSYRVKVGGLELEVARMHFGSSASFEWFIRNPKRKTITRLLGIDLTGYWKTSLAAAATSVGATEKIDIEQLIPGAYEKPRERFTRKEWALFKRYGLGDVQTTLELYHATAALLVSIDARVVRKTGVIPPSIPGAAARIMFAKAFDLHPELESWSRYPVWADAAGCASYYGGRSFSTRPGIYRDMASLDLKSAYPFQMALLPDPVTVQMKPIGPSAWKTSDWVGEYGVLYVSGVATDSVYPAFRTRDEARGGRLRYVVGRFENVPVTIPELVIGVLRGALEITAIHKGVLMQGSPEKSFLREGVRVFCDIKENKENAPALRAMGKLSLNAPYGKLIETTCKECYAPLPVVVMPFKKREEVAEGLLRVFSAPADDDLKDVYFGETPRKGRKAWGEYMGRLARMKLSEEEEASLKLQAYVDSVKAGGGELLEGPTEFLKDFLARYKRYSCGHFFFPLYASQVTGKTSAQLGLMAACTEALQGDTDSVHCRDVTVPDDVRLLEVRGTDQYFHIMAAAGYPAPRVERGEVVEGIPGLGALGTWEVENKTASIESVLVRPKVYSHKFRREDGSVWYKQAKHGFAKFDHPLVKALRADMRLSREDRAKAAREKLQAVLHDSMKCLVRGEDVSYTTRPSPRRLREAMRTGKPVGEFVSREVIVTRADDPNTYQDWRGIVHWRELGHEQTGTSEEQTTEGRASEAFIPERSGKRAPLREDSANAAE